MGGVPGHRGGVPGHRRGGGSTLSRGGVPGHREGVPGQVLPPVNRITDRCKNITFATSLRTVNKPSFPTLPLRCNSPIWVSSLENYRSNTQSNAVADPGFLPHRRGHQSQTDICPFVPENFMKLEDIGSRGGVRT